MSDIFISHIEEDYPIVAELTHGLEVAGFSTWFYERDSAPGASYLMQTREAIVAAQAVILIISPDSLSSTQVTKEVVRAHEAHKPFIPLLRGVSDSEYKRRQPEWEEAIGAATSLALPQGSIELILPRILRGLHKLGIQPGGLPHRPEPGPIPGGDISSTKPLATAAPAYATTAVASSVLAVAPTPTSSAAAHARSASAGTTVGGPTRGTESALSRPLWPIIFAGALSTLGAMWGLKSFLSALSPAPGSEEQFVYTIFPMVKTANLLANGLNTPLNVLVVLGCWLAYRGRMVGIRLARTSVIAIIITTVFWALLVLIAGTSAPAWAKMVGADRLTYVGNTLGMAVPPLVLLGVMWYLFRKDAWPE